MTDTQKALLDYLAALHRERRYPNGEAQLLIWIHDDLVALMELLELKEALAREATVKILVVPTCDGDVYFWPNTCHGKDEAIKLATEQVLGTWGKYDEETKQRIREAKATKMHFTLSEALFDVRAIWYAEVTR